MNGVKVTVKVYTGSKFKTYNLKKTSKGQVSFTTQGLNKSKHNVAVNVKSDSKINSASAKGTIKIN